MICNAQTIILLLGRKMDRFHFQLSSLINTRPNFAEFCSFLNKYEMRISLIQSTSPLFQVFVEMIIYNELRITK